MSFPDPEPARATLLAHYTTEMQDHRKAFLSAFGGGGVLSLLTILQAFGILPAGRPLQFGLALCLALVPAYAVYRLARMFWYGALVSNTPYTKIVIGSSGPMEPLLYQVERQIARTVRNLVKERKGFFLRRWLIGLGDTAETPRLVVVCALVFLIVFIALLFRSLSL